VCGVCVVCVVKDPNRLNHRLEHNSSKNRLKSSLKDFEDYRTIPPNILNRMKYISLKDLKRSLVLAMILIIVITIILLEVIDPHASTYSVYGSVLGMLGSV